MDNFETFPNDPITEAVLDIQVVLAPEIDLPKILSYHDLVRARFPRKREKIAWKQQVQFNEGVPEAKPSVQETEGYLFVGEDGTKVVQSRKTGFTFNKLKPYEHWDAFSLEAKELWETYSSLVSPINITRVALRYLNRLNLPLPIEDFRKFCLLFPEFPPRLAKPLSESFMRFGGRDAVSGARSLVSLAFEPPPQGATVLPLILDIDVFFEFEVLAPDTDAIWASFSNLRRLKNDIFFSSLTDAAKSMFR